MPSAGKNSTGVKRGKNATGAQARENLQLVSNAGKSSTWPLATWRQVRENVKPVIRAGKDQFLEVSRFNESIFFCYCFASIPVLSPSTAVI